MGRTNRCKFHESTCRASIGGLHTYNGSYFHHIASMIKARNYLQTYCSHSTKAIWNKIFASKRPSAARNGPCVCEGYGAASTIFSHADKPSRDVSNEEAYEHSCDVINEGDKENLNKSTSLITTNDKSTSKYQPVTVSMATKETVQDVKIQIEISKVNTSSNATSRSVCLSDSAEKSPISTGKRLHLESSTSSCYDNKLDENNNNGGKACFVDLNSNNNSWNEAESVSFSFSKPSEQKPHSDSCSYEAPRTISNFESGHAMNNNAYSVYHPLPSYKPRPFHYPGLDHHQGYRNLNQSYQTRSSVDYSHRWHQNTPRPFNNNSNMGPCSSSHRIDRHQFHNPTSDFYHCNANDNSYYPGSERFNYDVRGYQTNQNSNYFNDDIGGDRMPYSGY